MGLSRFAAVVPIVLLLFCSFFINTFASSILVRLALTCVSVVLALMVSLQARIRYEINGPMVALLLVCAMALLNQNHDVLSGEYSWLVFFFASLSVAIILGYGEGSPFRQAVKIVAYLGLFFSLATILMWIYPPLFEIVKETFFSASVSAGSYRSGFTAHYSTNAIYITFGIICCFALLLNESKNKQRAFYFVAFIICFFALLLTTKRAHLAIAIAACVSMYLLSGNRGLSRRVTGLIVWVTVAIVVFSIASQYIPELGMTIERIAELSDDDMFGSRSDLYSICFSLWKESPIFGQGWGSFTDALYGSLSGARFAAQGYYEIDAHNVFLQVLAEGGVVCLSLFFIWCVGSLIQTANLLKTSNDDSAYRIVAVASWGCQLFFLIYCFTGNPLYDIQVYIPCLLIGFGGYLCCWNSARKEIAQCHETPVSPWRDRNFASRSDRPSLGI